MCKLDDSILVSYYNAGEDIKRTKELDKVSDQFGKLIEGLSFSFEFDDAVMDLVCEKNKVQYIHGYKLAFKKYREANYDISKVKTHRNSIRSYYVYEIENSEIQVAEKKLEKYFDMIKKDKKYKEKWLKMDIAIIGMAIEESREYFIKGFKDGLSNLKGLFDIAA